MPELLKPESAARLLDVKTSTLKRWRRTNRGPAYIREGRIIRYSEDGLREWQEARMVQGVEGRE